MGRRPSGRRQRPTKRCSQASMPLYVPGLPECAAASSRPICSTDCWLLLPPDHANSVSSSMMSFLLPSYMHKRARNNCQSLQTEHQHLPHDSSVQLLVQHVQATIT